MRRCPGEGCQNTIPSSQPLCSGCTLRARQEEAAFALWVNNGFKAMETYLGWWALFESRYGPN